MPKILVILLAALLLSAAFPALALQPAPSYPDRVWKTDARQRGKEALPRGYRTMLDPFPEKERVPLPSRQGMDGLHISGSAQFSPEQFIAMIGDIRGKTGEAVCVFDLRQETHGFVNGDAVSLYAENNEGNAGLDTAQVLSLEREQLDALSGTELTLESSGKKGASEKSVLDVSSVMTEAELCASQDVLYVRVACTDHLCPTDRNVDEFVEACKSLPEGTWLHFHCLAGVGRTGLFMMMADMMRNPDVPLEDVIRRQVLLGANDPENGKGGERQDSDAKTDLLRRFHDYVAACGPDGYAVSFSDWSASAGE